MMKSIFRPRLLSMQRIGGTALNRVISLSIRVRTNRRITPQAFYCIRTMSTVNKSESEWRAVLSPEQVRTCLIPRFLKQLNSMVYVVQGSPSERH